MAITAAQLEVKFSSSGAGQVKGELKSLDSAVKSAGSGFEKMYQQVTGFADKAVAGISKLADGIGKVGLAGLGAIFLKGTTAAWKQVDAVEQATLALRAYEKDATKVDKVLKDLLAFARSDAGKLFMREELFHAAQTMKIAGAETENLTRYVEIMSRSVNAGMGTWVDLERVIARVGSTGRLTGIEFELLQQMGFQLDASLRNTTVTWEELFDVLDKGSVQISGQSDTIRGKLISLQTAIRGVGTAFLGVDSETSQFIEGGLGDRMVGGIDAAIAALERLQGAAATAGTVFSTILDGIEGLVGGFQMLPSSVQNVALGIAGAVAAFGMLRQAIAATTAAMRVMGLGAFTGLFSPLGLAITGVAIAGGLLIKSFMDQKAAAEEYKQSVVDLETALEMLRRQGDTDLADMGDQLRKQVNGLKTEMDALIETMRPDQMEFEAERFFEEFGRFPETTADLQAARTMYEAEFKLIQDAFEQTADSLRISTEDMTALNLKMLDAINDPNIDAMAWMTWAESLLTGAENAEELRSAVDLIIDTPLSEWSRHTVQDLDNLNAALDRTDQSWRDWQEGMGPFDPVGKVETVEWDDFVSQWEEDQERIRQDAAALAEEQAKLRAEWRQSAIEAAGFGDALSQLNMTGMTGEMGLFAESVNRAGQAFDNTFRILVTNVQSLGQGIQQAADWIDELVGAEGEWAAIDDLLAERRINQEQYNATLQAQADIAASNYDIQQNLLAVQAMQAPYIAEQVAATQAYVQELANMDAEAQRVALSFMDLQTVQQAQELITLGSSEAFRLMGAEGEAAFTQVIQGALQTNPLLFNVLETMGIISGTPMDFQVNFDAVQEAGSAIERLTEQVGYLVDTLREIYGLPPLKPEVDMSSVEAAASPGGPLGLLKSGFDALRDAHASPTVDVHVGDGTGGAPYILDDIANQLAGIDGTSATATINVIAGSAAVGDGTGGASNWRDMLDIPETIDTTINVAGSDQIAQVKADIDSLDDKTVTVDVVIGTNELDTGLAQFGIGTGGGGGAAGYTAPRVTVNVEADASDAIAQLEGVAGAAAAADALSVSIPAGAPGAEDASQKLEYLAGRAAAADALSVTVPVDTPGSATGIDQLQGVAGAAAAADAMSVTIPVSVSGAYTAIAQLNDVANAAANANRSVTVSVNTVNTTTYRAVGSPSSPIRAFAEGGHVNTRDAVLVGERGPELVQLPYGSYVHTADETARILAHRDDGIAPPRSSGSRDGGGDTYYVNVRIDGNVIGNDDFADAVAEHTVWKIASTKQRRDLAKGVAA